MTITNEKSILFIASGGLGEIMGKVTNRGQLPFISLKAFATFGFKSRSSQIRNMALD
jgi:hypothetical protein